LLKDQRGSPAYISPDVLSGKPYLGKPSDMWALGVVLFTMLYGQFPFYDSVPQVEHCGAEYICLISSLSLKEQKFFPSSVLFSILDLFKSVGQKWEYAKHNS
jgi:serine/threonine protein kinase